VCFINSERRKLNEYKNDTKRALLLTTAFIELAYTRRPKGPIFGRLQILTSEKATKHDPLASPLKRQLQLESGIGNANMPSGMGTGKLYYSELGLISFFVEMTLFLFAQ
jgi:hypothetical protein